MILSIRTIDRIYGHNDKSESGKEAAASTRITHVNFPVRTAASYIGKAASENASRGHAEVSRVLHKLAAAGEQHAPTGRDQLATFQLINEVTRSTLGLR